MGEIEWGHWLTTMYNETIIYYSKNHPNKWVLDNFDVEFWEDNRTCWDDLKVYLKNK